jgi:hypothetical protein
MIKIGKVLAAMRVIQKEPPTEETKFKVLDLVKDVMDLHDGLSCDTTKVFIRKEVGAAQEWAGFQ